MRILQQNEISQRLTDLPDWTGGAEAITRVFTAEDFPAGIALVDAVAAAAERRDHHPDIDIRWRTVRFRLSTHSAGGVTDLDLDLAHEIEALIQAQRGSADPTDAA